MANKTSTTSIDKLLDKPFSELTRDEWERVGKYKPRKVNKVTAV